MAAGNLLRYYPQYTKIDLSRKKNASKLVFICHRTLQIFAVRNHSWVDCEFAQDTTSNFDCISWINVVFLRAFEWFWPSYQFKLDKLYILSIECCDPKKRRVKVQLFANQRIQYAYYIQQYMRHTCNIYQCFKLPSLCAKNLCSPFSLSLAVAVALDHKLENSKLEFSIPCGKYSTQQ